MIRLKTAIVPLVACALAVAAWPTSASGQYTRDQQNRQRQTQQQRQQQARARQMQNRQMQNRRQAQEQNQFKTLSGRLVGVRQVRLSNERQPHVLAKVRTQRGVVVVDLGTARDVNRAQLRRGGQIRVGGVPGRINQQPIFVAQRVSAREGEVIRIARASEPRMARRAQQAAARQAGQRQAQRQGQAQAQRLSVQGQVVAVRPIQLRGEQNRHRLAKIRTQQGKTVVVDLNALKDRRAQQLQQGQTVRIRGVAGRINDKPILVARQINIGGQGQGGAQPSNNRTNATTY